MTVAQCLFVIASKVITDNSSSVGSVMLSGREGNCYVWRHTGQESQSVMYTFTSSADGEIVISTLSTLILSIYALLYELITFCLQCFDTVGWVAGRASGL